MNIPRTFMILATALLLAGCSGGTTGPGASSPAKPDDESKIQANLDKLDPADRKLAEAQRYCVIESDNRLGAMGKPVKVVIKGEPVFLCCKGCEKEALADPDKTLARVHQLQAKQPRSSERR